MKFFITLLIADLVNYKSAFFISFALENRNVILCNESIHIPHKNIACMIIAVRPVMPAGERTNPQERCNDEMNAQGDELYFGHGDGI